MHRHDGRRRLFESDDVKHGMMTALDGAAQNLKRDLEGSRHGSREEAVKILGDAMRETDHTMRSLDDVERAFQDVVDFDLRSGDDGGHANDIEIDGIRLMHYAAMHSTDSVIHMLVANYGAKVDEALGRDRRTPLHAVCALDANPDRVGVVNALLHHGADPNARTAQGLTPMDLAASSNGGDYPMEAEDRIYALEKHGGRTGGIRESASGRRRLFEDGGMTRIGGTNAEWTAKELANRGDPEWVASTLTWVQREILGDAVGGCDSTSLGIGLYDPTSVIDADPATEGMDYVTFKMHAQDTIEKVEAGRGHTDVSIMESEFMEWVSRQKGLVGGVLDRDDRSSSMTVQYYTLTVFVARRGPAPKRRRRNSNPAGIPKWSPHHPSKMKESAGGRRRVFEALADSDEGALTSLLYRVQTDAQRAIDAIVSTAGEKLSLDNLVHQDKVGDAVDGARSLVRTWDYIAGGKDDGDWVPESRRHGGRPALRESGGTVTFQRGGGMNTKDEIKELDGLIDGLLAQSEIAGRAAGERSTGDESGIGAWDDFRETGCVSGWSALADMQMRAFIRGFGIGAPDRGGADVQHLAGRSGDPLRFAEGVEHLDAESAMDLLHQRSLGEEFRRKVEKESGFKISHVGSEYISDLHLVLRFYTEDGSKACVGFIGDNFRTREEWKREAENFPDVVDRVLELEFEGGSSFGSSVEASAVQGIAGVIRDVAAMEGWTSPVAESSSREETAQWHERLKRDLARDRLAESEDGAEDETFLSFDSQAHFAKRMAVFIAEYLSSFIVSDVIHSGDIAKAQGIRDLVRARGTQIVGKCINDPGEEVVICDNVAPFVSDRLLKFAKDDPDRDDGSLLVPESAITGSDADADDSGTITGEIVDLVMDLVYKQGFYNDIGEDRAIDRIVGFTVETP